MMNSVVCVDASLVVRTLVYGPYSAETTFLLKQWSSQGTTLIAPSLFVFETASTLRRLVYHREITEQEGEEAFRFLLMLKIRLSHRRAVISASWDLAQAFSRPRAYDTAYLALAQLHRCDLWTADEKLYNTVRGALPWVRWVGDVRLAGSE